MDGRRDGVSAQMPLDISRLRFLLVEDQSFQRWMLESVVRKLGAQTVHTAGDGSAALEVLGDESSFIDIVVTDLDMPGMDGLEFIRRIGESRWSPSLILSSALDRALISSVETMADAYGVRLLGTVDKPVTAERLAEVIARYRPVRAAAALAPAPLTPDDARRAFEDDRVDLFFQPKVRLANGELAGAEALVRWRHPERGMLPAQEFIGLIEQAGLLDAMTQRVVGRAAGACRKWLAEGIDASVAVNISLATAGGGSLADWLLQIVQSHGLEPRRMVLEVTETAQAEHVGKTLEELSRLRMRGFGLSIDDYGMGYSSMQQLMRIPFTELKIDRDFVRKAAARPTERAALESSLELAAKLRIVAVAEGVETQAEWELLRELGCDLAQGYFVAAPLPEGEFAAWARRGSAQSGRGGLR